MAGFWPSGGSSGGIRKGETGHPAAGWQALYDYATRTRADRWTHYHGGGKLPSFALP